MLAVLRVEDSISWGKEMKEERAKYFFLQSFLLSYNGKCGRMG